MTGTDAAGLLGYAVAAPFTLWPPLFKRMWHAPDARLLAVHEAGVALIVVGWLGAGGRGAALGNGAYGVAVALLWARALARR